MDCFGSCFKKGVRNDSKDPSEKDKNVKTEQFVGKSRVESGQLIINFPQMPLVTHPFSKVTEDTMGKSQLNRQYLQQFHYSLGWSQRLRNSKKGELDKEITQQIFRQNNSRYSFINFLIFYLDLIAHLIKEKRFIVNISLLELVKNEFHLSNYSNIFKIEEIISDTKIDNIRNQNIPRYVESLKQIFKSVYKMFQDFDTKQIVVATFAYLEKLKQQIKELDIYYEDFNMEKGSNLKVQIAQQLYQFMEWQMINQYFLNVRYLIPLLKIVDRKKEYQLIDKLFYDLSKKKVNLKMLKQIIANIKLGKISHAKEIDDDQQQKKQTFNYPKKERKEQAFQLDKNSNLQKQEGKKQSVKVLQKKLQQQKRFYHKFYRISDIKTDNRFCERIIFIKYIKSEENDQRKLDQYKLQTLLIQNFMHVIRYLENKPNLYQASYRIKLDQQADKRPFESDREEEQTQCFKFYCEKGEKQFSRLHLNRCISSDDIWKFRDRKIVYGFLFSFAEIIQQLQALRIHQVDFAFQNFIKVGNRFLLIDFGHAYFAAKETDKQLNSQRQFTKQIFEYWIKCNSDTHVANLITCHEKFRHYRYKYKMNDAVNHCADLMFNSMVRNHFQSFRKLIVNLFQNFDESIISLDEKNSILQLIPQQTPRNNRKFYQQFNQRLDKIYRQYHQASDQLLKDNDKIQLQYVTLSTILNNFDSRHLENYRQSFKIKYQSIINLFKINKPNCVVTYQKITNLEHAYHHYIIYYRDGINPAELKDIISRPRYIMNFLINYLEVIQYFERNGYLLLNLGIQSFAKICEEFKLKNLDYVFKLKQDVICIQEDQKLVRQSKDLLFKLIIKGHNQSKDKIFDSEILENIHTLIYGDRDSSDLAGLLDQMRQYGLNQEYDECANSLTTLNKIRTLTMLLMYKKKIHFKQFKQVAEKILSQASNQEATLINKIKNSIKNRNDSNYLKLLRDFEQISQQCKQLLRGSY